MSRFARLFDGWQAGLAVVVTAALLALLVVPRPSLPEEIPLPRVNYGKLQHIMKEDFARAAMAEHEGLPFEVRQVGDSFRRHGQATASGDRMTMKRMQLDLDRQVREARQLSDEKLLQLRAYQMESFLRALRDFERTGKKSLDLEELGGDFIHAARESGWLRSHRGGSIFVANEMVRRILFHKRWNQVLGLKGGPFGISLEEERAFHAFLFQNPVVQLPSSHRYDPPMRCRSANEYLLRRVISFGAQDPSYPADYAQGVILLRLGQYQKAVLVLVRFLDNNPDGPYTLHARNALRHAQNQMHTLLTR